MARQEIWEREDPEPPVLSVILGEAVLRQRVGGAAVMREQFARLVESARNPRITIQVMPFTANAHPGLLGPFVVASFENGPAAAYLDSVLDGQVSERRQHSCLVTALAAGRSLLTPGREHRRRSLLAAAAGGG